MLEISFLNKNKEIAINGLHKRGLKNAEELIVQAINVDTQRRSIQTELDSIKAEANKFAKSIGKLMKEGKKEEAENAKKQSSELKEKTKKMDTELQNVIENLQNLLAQIPNIPHTSVSAGVNEEANETIKQVGEIIELEKDALAHWDIIKNLDIIDFDLGNKVTGAGFPFYKGKGAKLQRALISFFLDEAEKQGYQEIQAPILINRDSGFGTGQLPDKDGQMYHATDDNLYLIPTAEVPITNIYRNVILDAKDFPKKHVGYTPCFRREAGSWGSHVRGLNRLHQFDKVEIVQITHPEKSYEILEEMSNYVQNLLEKLALPYRVLRLCGGDLGFTSALTYDMEVFSAGQKRWLEVSSVSNFETYQANRLQLRFRGKDNKKFLAHTLNGSALALPRIMAAILENNQENGGKLIKIPEVLHPYTNFEVIE